MENGVPSPGRRPRKQPTRFLSGDFHFIGNNANGTYSVWRVDGRTGSTEPLINVGSNLVGSRLSFDPARQRLVMGMGAGLNSPKSRDGQILYNGLIGIDASTSWASAAFSMRAARWSRYYTSNGMQERRRWTT